MKPQVAAHSYFRVFSNPDQYNHECGSAHRIARRRPQGKLIHMKQLLLRKLSLLPLLAAGTCLSSHAQTAYWTNSAGGDWNTAANWDVDQTGFNAVPGSGTNASIGAIVAAAVAYNAPMAAPNFLTLSLNSGSSLDVNAAGFNLDGMSLGNPSLTIGGTLNVNSGGELTSLNGGTSTVQGGGALNVSGSALISAIAGTSPLVVDPSANVTIHTGGTLTLADGLASTVGAGSLIHINGGSLVVSNGSGLNLLTSSALTLDGGSLIGTNNLAGEFAWGEGTGNDANAGVAITNNGGTIILDRTLRLRSRDTRFTMNSGHLELIGGLAYAMSGNDGRQWFLIKDGTANLHDVTINRASTSGGLRIENGVVTTTSARIGVGVAAGYSIMTGGVWTNQGVLYVADRNNAADSGSRRVFLRIDGGTLVTEGSEGIVVNAQGESTTANLSNVGGELVVNGGTITAEGIQLNGPAVTANAMARLNIANGTIYLGSVGLVVNTNPAASLTAAITLSGGTIGAKADWTSTANLPLGGPIVIKAADEASVARSITLDGVLSGSGTLTKTGAGTLTLGGANTYSGVTYIDNGTLALGTAGSLASPQVILSAGTTFDISAVAGGYTLPPTRSIAGFGTVTGNLISGGTSIINPGTNTVTGTLTINGSLTQSGSAITHFDLSTNPTGPDNDLLVVTGDLNVSGLNTIEIVGGGAAGSVHPLIQYGGSFNGNLSAFSLSGVSGTLTNNTSTKTIALIVASAVRLPTSVTWTGNPVQNVWDVLTHTNWLNAGALDFFVTGDTVLFDAAGAARPNVSIVGNVSPAAITVDAATDYTFLGEGSISGAGTLNKTNSGTLSIVTTNLYTGATIIGGGTLAVNNIADAGFGSGIGAATVDPANLQFDGGSLRYFGETTGTTRGATLNPGGGRVVVSNATVALTISGQVIGSGALVKDGPGTLVFNGANSFAGGTVVSNGVLQLGSASSAGTGSIGLRNGAGLRISGSYTMTNNLDFAGTVVVDLNNNVPSGDRHLVGEWSGNATILITNSPDVARTFTIGGNGGMSAFSGIVDLGNSSTRLRFNHNDTSPNTGSPNVHFKLGSGNVILEPRNGGVTVDLGAVEGGPLTAIRGRASGQSGTVTYAIGALNLSTLFEGSISNSPSGNTTAIRKVGTGTLTLSGISGYTGDTTVEAGTLEVNGTLGNTLTMVQGGTLAGSGTIEGFVNVLSGATLSPGSTVGAMTIINSLQLDSGSTTIMELHPAAGTNDSVLGLASVSYSGTLLVTNVGGSFSVGQIFTLFQSTGGYGGAFENIILPTLPAGMDWETNNLVVDGTISVTGIAQPEVSVARSGNSLILNGSNGIPGATYNILTSTNLASPLSAWTAIETNVLDVNGAFSFTNAINPATPQRFFILSLPLP